MGNQNFKAMAKAHHYPDWRILGTVLILMVLSHVICRSENFISPLFNSYRDGDNLDRLYVGYVTPGPRGANVVWNLDNTEFIRGYASSVSVMSDTVTVYSPDACYYYRDNSDSLAVVGYENRLSKIMYDTPRLVRPANMQYGDSVSGCYSGKGAYCGKLDLDITASCYSVADACGIIVADGDTIRDVLRVHCHREEIIRRQECASGSGASVADSIGLLTDSHGADVVEDRWLWYAAGSRYPVLESVSVRSGDGDSAYGKPEFSYLYLPEDQMMTLAYDSENTRRRQNIANRPAAPQTDASDSPEFPVHADITLSNDGRTVAVSYRQDFTGTVSFTACDVNGMVLGFFSRQGDCGSFDFDMQLTRQPVGNVVVMYVEAEGMTMSRKVYKDRH